MTPLTPTTVPGSELRLADVVRLWEHSPWGDAIVHRIEDEVVHLRRPYMVHEDFEHSGGVITSIGLEDFAASRRTTFELVRRGPDLR